MPTNQPWVDQRLFGLRVRSNHLIPFATSSASDGVDVVVRCGELPPWLETVAIANQKVDRDQAPYVLARAGDAHLLTYPDRTEFVITTTEVWMKWRAPLNFDDACVYLLGAVFALVVRLRGGACLHASAVTIDGQTIAFAGPSGSGKSTVAAALVRRGATLVSEDVLPLMGGNGRVLAQPSHEAIRLWPEAVELLTGDRETLPCISPTWDKRALRADRVATEGTPLSCVMVFEDRAQQLKPAEGAMRLVANSYRPEMLDAAMRRREFEMFTDLANTTTIRALVRGDHDPETLATMVLDACTSL